MRTFRNLKGTIMLRDEPLVQFTIERGQVVELKKMSDQLPCEFYGKISDSEALLYFLDDRLVPETRIGLQQELEQAGIPYFDPDRILKYNNGNTVTDSYWIRFKEGVQTFKELRDKIGLSDVD